MFRQRKNRAQERRKRNGDPKIEKRRTRGKRTIGAKFNGDASPTFNAENGAVGAKFNGDAFPTLKAKKPERQRQSSKRENANGRGGVKIGGKNDGNATAIPNRETASAENGAIGAKFNGNTFPTLRAGERERRPGPSKLRSSNGGVLSKRENADGGVLSKRENADGGDVQSWRTRTAALSKRGNSNGRGVPIGRARGAARCLHVAESSMLTAAKTAREIKSVQRLPRRKSSKIVT